MRNHYISVVKHNGVETVYTGAVYTKRVEGGFEVWDGLNATVLNTFMDGEWFSLYEGPNDETLSDILKRHNEQRDELRS